MLTINHELEMTLHVLANQERISAEEFIQRLVHNYISQKQAQALQNQVIPNDEQLNIGREFMREYHETFSELAK